MSIKCGPDINENGLVLFLDAANRLSYPGSGTAWSDLSGNSNTGTLTNGPTFSAGNMGSILFDGTDDYASTGKVLVPRTGGFHIDGWVYLNNTNTAKMFVTQYFNGVDAGRFQCYFEDDGTIRMHDGGGSMTGTNPSYSANVWIYVAYQRDSNNLCNIFVNGIQATTGATKTSTLQDTNTIIGSRGTSQSGTWFNGMMSNVRIYNRALTATEILQNYNAVKSRFGR